MKFTIRKMMKNWKIKLFAIIFIIVLFSVFTIPTNANEGGYGDSFFEGDECISCHAPGENLGLGTGYTSIALGSLNPLIKVRVRVNMANIPTPSDKYGVLLLTEEYGNLSEDGWNILDDPNENEVPKNYIERPRNDNDLLEWRISNSPGHYVVRILTFYGSNSQDLMEERHLNITISIEDINSPPIFSSPKAILLADEKTYDFEVTYIDPEGEYPRNISVNISGLGSFDMLPKTQPPFDFENGVTYYYLTTLPEARYSYHFAAFDGNSWNSTSNSFFYTSAKDKGDVNFTPLVFGMIIAAVVVSAVYILRKK
jgi:hypothetical protein